MWLSVRAAGMLPMEKNALIAEKYDSWTGVLRLWVFEGWPSGNNSFTAWLNFSIAEFEKDHPGAYVQARQVDAQAIRELATSGVNPPDLILFPPGLLESTENLTPLSIDAPLRPGLISAAQSDAPTFAVPVAMGAYAWAYDRARTDSTFANALPLSAPADELHRCWSGALLCLCSDTVEESNPNSSSTPTLPGLDLGLPTNAVSGAHSVRAPETSESAVCTTQKPFLPIGDSQGAMSLEQGIQGDGVPLAFSSDAYSDFTNGAAAAIPVTQREIRRLELLAESGRGPDWAVSMPGKYALADQLALIAVVDWPRKDAAERQQLGQELIAHLLSEEIQKELSRSRAFPTRADTFAYEGHGAMAQIEAALAEKKLIVPSAFGRKWQGDPAAVLDEFLAGQISADEAIRRFTGN